MIGKRLFWFALGAGATAWVVLKGRDYYQKFTPKGVANQIEMVGKQVSGWVYEFVTTFNQAADNRERELRQAAGFDE